MEGAFKRRKKWGELNDGFLSETRANQNEPLQFVEHNPVTFFLLVCPLIAGAGLQHFQHHAAPGQDEVNEAERMPAVHF